MVSALLNNQQNRAKEDIDSINDLGCFASVLRDKQLLRYAGSEASLKTLELGLNKAVRIDPYFRPLNMPICNFRLAKDFPEDIGIWIQANCDIQYDPKVTFATPEQVFAKNRDQKFLLTLKRHDEKYTSEVLVKNVSNRFTDSEGEKLEFETNTGHKFIVSVNELVSLHRAGSDLAVVNASAKTSQMEGEIGSNIDKVVVHDLQDSIQKYFARYQDIEVMTDEGSKHKMIYIETKKIHNSDGLYIGTYLFGFEHPDCTRLNAIKLDQILFVRGLVQEGSVYVEPPLNASHDKNFRAYSIGHPLYSRVESE